jgi:hypothetical protein
VEENLPEIDYKFLYTPISLYHFPQKGPDKFYPAFSAAFFA